jgi:hypothetical protein
MPSSATSVERARRNASTVPDLVDEASDRDDLVGVHEQRRQQRALARAAETGRGAVDQRLEWPENAELDSHARRA